MKLRLFLILVSLAMANSTLFAEGLAFDGTVTDDITHKKYEKARVEIDFNETKCMAAIHTATVIDSDRPLNL